MVLAPALVLFAALVVELFAALVVEFIAVLLLEYEPRARTFSPTWSAKLPAIMLEAVTVTSLLFLPRIVNCPLLALSRQPTTESFPALLLLARVSFCLVAVVVFVV